MTAHRKPEGTQKEVVSIRLDQKAQDRLDDLVTSDRLSGVKSNRSRVVERLILDEHERKFAQKD